MSKVRSVVRETRPNPGTPLSERLKLLISRASRALRPLRGASLEDDLGFWVKLVQARGASIRIRWTMPARLIAQSPDPPAMWNAPRNPLEDVVVFPWHSPSLSRAARPCRPNTRWVWGPFSSLQRPAPGSLCSRDASGPICTPCRPERGCFSVLAVAAGRRSHSWVA